MVVLEECMLDQTAWEYDLDLGDNLYTIDMSNDRLRAKNFEDLCNAIMKDNDYGTILNVRTAVAQKLDDYSQCNQEEILDYMEEYYWDATIQLKACNAIHELINNADSEYMESVALTIMKKGAGSKIMRLMDEIKNTK